MYLYYSEVLPKRLQLFSIAQLVEHGFDYWKVIGSNPGFSLRMISKLFEAQILFQHTRFSYKMIYQVSLSNNLTELKTKIRVNFEYGNLEFFILVKMLGKGSPNNDHLNSNY